MNPAVFMDRDGTLIRDKHYLKDPGEVEWIPGVFPGLQQLDQAGFDLVLTTNQSGVARGLMTEQDVEAVHQRMRDDLEQRGIQLDAVEYCPYLEKADHEEYGRASRRRKPAPGMIEDVLDRRSIDESRSYVVGDKTSDLEAGRRAGCQSILVRTGKGRQSESELADQSWAPEAVVETFGHAVTWILDRSADPPV